MIRINDQILPGGRYSASWELNRHDRNAVPSRDHSAKHIFLLSAAECPKILAGTETSPRAETEPERGNSLWCPKL